MGYSILTFPKKISESFVPLIPHKEHLPVMVTLGTLLSLMWKGFLAWIAIQPLRIQCIALAKIWTHNKNTIWLHRRLFILGKGQEIVICMPSTFYKQWTYSTLKIQTHTIMRDNLSTFPNYY